MSIVDKKRKIFGNIAATKTLTESFPKLKTTSSLPSMNNGGNSITFLTDLIKALIGYGALITELVSILTHSLTKIEREVKIALKRELKIIVSCGVDPSLPSFIKATSPTGLVIEVNKVDFLDLFMVDPNSVAGKLLYNDITPTLTDSTDFNTFLYGAIQEDGIPKIWNGIFEITFNSIKSGYPNNTFTIKATPTYSTAPKTLTDLNNDFIDSLTLFNTQNIVNRIIDLIFGSVSVSINRTRKQLEMDAKINNVIDNIINSDSDNEVSDCSFEFSNDEVYRHEEEADFRKKGILKLECCNKVSASIPVDMLTTFTNEMTGATTTQDKKVVITKNLEVMANQNTVNSSTPSDHISIKLNFIQQIINNLIKAIVGMVLSPKVVMIFLINFKIIFKSITKQITTMIVKILVAIALKKIAELVAASAAKKQIEKGKNKVSQLLSLVGIPQEALRLIKGLL